MKKQTLIISTLYFLLTISVGFAQTNTQSVLTHFKMLVGKWQGTLTYLDYSSGKPYTMPANINMEQIGNTSAFVVFHIYPDEPSANTADTITIYADKKRINNETIVAKRTLKNGNVEIVTEYLGTDGNENSAAKIRHIYTIGKMVFTKKKEIQFVGQTKWIKRHEYSYTK